MSEILKIKEIGEDILKKKALPVSDFLDPKLKTLAESMMATMLTSNGVGLAAPQVGESIRLLVMNPYPTKKGSETLVVINPEITAKSKDKERAKEGCLSVPGLIGSVARFCEISVHYYDLDGTEKTLDLKGFPARVLQHELDHLDGLLFLDRLTSPKDLFSEENHGNTLV